MSIPNSVLQKEHVAITFGTPVSSYLWPDSDALNAALKNVILEKKKAYEGIKRSNSGGWHSKPDMFLWQADCVHTLKDRVTTCAADMTRLFAAPEGPRKISFQLDCWTNVSRRGAYNKCSPPPWCDVVRRLLRAFDRVGAPEQAPNVACPDAETSVVPMRL
jgi:hypothetical protein